jgi:hypothetical protein
MVVVVVVNIRHCNIWDLFARKYFHKITFSEVTLTYLHNIFLFFITGDEKSFLFSLYPEVRVCESTGYNNHYQYLNVQQQTLPNGLVGVTFEFNTEQ